MITAGIPVATIIIVSEIPVILTIYNMKVVIYSSVTRTIDGYSHELFSENLEILQSQTIETIIEYTKTQMDFLSKKVERVFVLFSRERYV
jgi:hypothetical protein